MDDGQASTGSLPRGPWIAVDVGRVRVGIAASDPEGRMAFPVETVSRGPNTVDRIARIVSERGVVAIVVGLPLTLSGKEGPSAADARSFAVELAQRLDLPVRLIDERLSTSAASRALRDAGRDSRKSRTVVDQAAAVVILETALDGRNNGILDSLAKPATLGES